MTRDARGLLSFLRWSLGLWLCLALLTAPVAVSAEGAVLRLEPASAGPLEVGSTVDVAVRLENVEGLYALDVRLSFDPAVLEIVDMEGAKEGVQMQPGQFPQPDFAVSNEADNTAGTLWYAVTQVNPREALNGAGVVMTVRVRGKSVGSSPIAFTYYKVVQRTGEVIPASTTEDLELSVVGAASAVSAPTLAPVATVAAPTPTVAATLTVPTVAAQAVQPVATAQPAPAASASQAPFGRATILVLVVIVLGVCAVLFVALRRRGR